MCPETRKNISRERKKASGKANFIGKEKNTTLLTCISATGTFIPQFMVFPRARINPALILRFLEQYDSLTHQNGWILPCS